MGEGFRIIDGAHIPSGGQGAAEFGSVDPDAPVPARAQPQQLPVAPRTRPAPRPVAASPSLRPVSLPAPQPQIPDYDDEPVDPNFNPFINPHDPTHRNFAFNKNGAKFAPKVPGILDSSNVPPCAGCEGLNPFVNPFDASHHNAGIFQVQTPRRPAPIAPRRPAPIAQPQQPASLPTSLTTTPTPKRFFPPGQIQLNRFETGFNFDFQ